MYRVRYSDEHDFHVVRMWVEDNCRHEHYAGHDWHGWVFNQKNRIYEFHNEQDAVLFALRWS